MVDSFRGGVSLWLNDLLNADLYIAPVEFEDGDLSFILPPDVTQVTIPADLLLDDSGVIKYEVLAREESYNQTATESCFNLQ